MAYLHSDTICAPATAGGIGAIGIIRVSGPDAIRIVSKLFHGHNLLEQATHTIHFGTIREGDNIIDEVLASVFIAPSSYTGEHTIELSCHGSPYIMQRILELLVQHGCRMARPGEFTQRAFLNRRLDLSQAEAVADLIASDSEESHRMAMHQMRGGFSKQLSAMRERLIHFASMVELELDFAEEDVEFASRNELRAFVEEILDLLQTLIQSFQYGNAIRNGVPTVIAGKPNAGKSTLLNALLNENRALVSDIAGTTRDTIEERFVAGGITFRLTDTAGIRSHTADLIEGMGIERTYEKIRQASIILYLFDIRETTPEALHNELQSFQEYPALLIAVANKCDTATPAPGYPECTLFISAKQQNGLDQLLQRLVQAVQQDRIKNDIIITNLRHFEALKQAHDALHAVQQGIAARISGELLAFDIRRALHALGEITGEITTDDLLANIFSRFCIGK